MVRTVPRILFALAGLALIVAACGDSSDGGIPGATEFPDGAFGVRASSDLGIGPERLLMGVSLEDGTRLGAPDQPITLEISPLNELDAVQTVPGIFTWILEPVVGLYRAEVNFDRSGPWQATVIGPAGDRLGPVAFNVFDDPFAPQVGEVAPVPPTPTLDDLPIEQLTTDDEPDLAFYEQSLEEAVASGKPTVLVFSTPAFCQTSACGPLLDTVKDEAPAFPDVNFIHVEVFTGWSEPGFIPDSAHRAIGVTEEWYSLPSEPWVFVIDRAGIVAARFEGVMDGSELVAVLEKISL